MRHRQAFTLLELLIASALLSMLMLLVWSLFSTYTRLEERSSRSATELQLMRSVSQQLRSDIEHVAMPMAQPKPDATPANELDNTSDTSEKNQEALEDPQNSDDSLELDSDVNDTEAAPPANDIVPSLRLDFGEQQELDPQQSNTPQVFDSSLLETMYFRGSATKLEIVIRQPYTVDVPTGNQLLGSETRYGTHQFVIYEWRDTRDLSTLLADDPVLNPAKFTPPPADPLRDPSMPAPAPITPTRLNPNDNVGLIRESKSWLHITRDQRRDTLIRQAESAGLLVGGKFPWERQPQTLDSPTDQQQGRHELNSLTGDANGDTLQPMWTPPPEFRHRRDHIPEITRLQFRYFDGKSWQLDWSDNTRLPMAVEIAFDLDPKAPAARVKEFEDAHAAMLGGASLVAVLPPQEELPVETPDLDPLLSTDILDPTAIVTEYRFVIGVPRSPSAKDQTDEQVEVEDEELSFSLEDSN